MRKHADRRYQPCKIPDTVPTTRYLPTTKVLRHRGPCRRTVRWCACRASLLLPPQTPDRLTNLARIPLAPEHRGNPQSVPRHQSIPDTHKRLHHRPRHHPREPPVTRQHRHAPDPPIAPQQHLARRTHNRHLIRRPHRHQSHRLLRIRDKKLQRPIRPLPPQPRDGAGTNSAVRVIYNRVAQNWRDFHHLPNTFIMAEPTVRTNLSIRNGLPGRELRIYGV